MEQRRSLSPEVKGPVGVEAVEQRLRESLALTKRMASSKLLQHDLDSASQVGWAAALLCNTARLRTTFLTCILACGSAYTA